MRTMGPLTCVMAGVVRSLFQSDRPGGVYGAGPDGLPDGDDFQVGQLIGRNGQQAGLSGLRGRRRTGRRGLWSAAS